MSMWQIRKTGAGTKLSSGISDRMARVAVRMPQPGKSIRRPNVVAAAMVAAGWLMSQITRSSP